MGLSREAAWNLVTEFVQGENLRKHLLAVEAAVRGYARTFGEDEDDWGAVALLHALLGAELVREELGIEDEQVLRAVACHTTGEAAMTTLDKVVYLADVIEPGRRFPGVERLRELAWRDLDAAVLAALRGSVADLVRTGRKVDRRTLEAIASLEGTERA